MGNPHILTIPYPAQGHVIPMLELSQCLVREGFRVTFVNTIHNHERVLNALPNKDYLGDQLNLVSIPDGLTPWEDRNNIGKFLASIFEVMPGKLEELLERMNKSDKEEERITCIIADEVLDWALEIAEKKGIPKATFWSSAAALLSLKFSIPKLIENGIINEVGTPVKEQVIQLAPNMPSMNTADFAWCRTGDLSTQIIAFNHTCKNIRNAKLADWIICNSAFDLEPGAFTYNSPSIIPIGPLLASNRHGSQIGNFWPGDSTCLKWLDQQPINSVIYVAFGSHTILNRNQFEELALGLELSNRPFLWVVRPDLISEINEAYPEGYRARIASRGHLVNWAPQQKVLSHPSIACFLSHCGWNSTMEGLSNGIPFLCWPYFCDQFLNESYICDVWKVGMRFNKNEMGIITKLEIKNKVQQLVGDGEFKRRALDMKEIAVKSVSEDGHSSKAFKGFCEWIKIHSC